MMNDAFAQLMALRFSGEATEEQLRRLEQYLAANPDAYFFYEIFSNYWNLKHTDADSDVQEEIHFQQIIAIAEKEPAPPTALEPAYEAPPRRIFSVKGLLIAASLIGIVALSYILFKKNSPATEKPNNLTEVAARAGALAHMMLPDGSTVWLNAESKLEYNESFTGDVREVYLEGEAYFDVVKDSEHPFIVHTSDLDIKVLGTVFNVKSYPAEPLIEATLIHGMIEVTHKKQPASPKVILRPHDKLVFNKSAQQPASEKDGKPAVAVKPFAITKLPKNIADTAIAEISWIYNKLVFDGETFREIAAKMERWYDVIIRFKNEKAANMRIHFEFKNESIEEALKALQTIEPFNYNIKGNEIEILKK